MSGHYRKIPHEVLWRVRGGHHEIRRGPVFRAVHRRSSTGARQRGGACGSFLGVASSEELLHPPAPPADPQRAGDNFYAPPPVPHPAQWVMPGFFIRH